PLNAAAQAPQTCEQFMRKQHWTATKLTLFGGIALLDGQGLGRIIERCSRCLFHLPFYICHKDILHVRSSGEDCSLHRRSKSLRNIALTRIRYRLSQITVELPETRISSSRLLLHRAGGRSGI